MVVLSEQPFSSVLTAVSQIAGPMYFADGVAALELVSSCTLQPAGQPALPASSAGTAAAAARLPCAMRPHQRLAVTATCLCPSPFMRPGARCAARAPAAGARAAGGLASPRAGRAHAAAAGHHHHQRPHPQLQVPATAPAAGGRGRAGSAGPQGVPPAAGLAAQPWQPGQRGAAALAGKLWQQ